MSRAHDNLRLVVARHEAARYPQTSERLVAGSDLDHWLWTAGELSNVRDELRAAEARVDALEEENRYLRLTLSVLLTKWRRGFTPDADDLETMEAILSDGTER